MSNCNCGQTSGKCGCKSPKPNKIKLYTPGAPTCMTEDQYLLDRCKEECDALIIGAPIYIKDKTIAGDGEATCEGWYIPSDRCKGSLDDLVMQADHFDPDCFTWNAETCKWEIDPKKVLCDKIEIEDAVPVGAHIIYCDPANEGDPKKAPLGQFPLPMDDTKCTNVKVGYDPEKVGLYTYTKDPLPRGMISLVQKIGGTLSVVHDGSNFETRKDFSDDYELLEYRIIKAKGVFSADDYCFFKEAGNKLQVTSMANIGYYAKVSNAAETNKHTLSAAGQFGTELFINGTSVSKNTDMFGCDQTGFNDMGSCVQADVWETDGSDVTIELDIIWGVTVDIGTTAAFGGMAIGDSLEVDMVQVLIEFVDASDAAKVVKSIDLGASITPPAP